MSSWTSYPSIYALGHKAVAELLNDPVLVEEKIDGSQFSFGLFEDGYKARSKGAQLNLIAPDSMFKRAVEVIQGLPLHEGWTYRAEYLMRPKHNVMAYDHIPAQHLILFDINPGEEDYLPWETKADEAAKLGIDVVPKLFEGKIEDLQFFRALLETPSCLGGQKVEGVVVKNYQRFGRDKKVLMGKFVSEAFKEVHARVWKAENSGPTDLVGLIISRYHTAARWQKALQHLEESGQLEGSPRDIGLLIKEVPIDVEKECSEEIKELLWSWAWPKVRRGLTSGLPEWYKERLLERQFEGSDSG